MRARAGPPRGAPSDVGPVASSDAAAELEQAAEATHAFTVQGPQQALAMLVGLKLIENRAWRIPPGWYALHVGAQRRSEWGERAAARHPELPREEELEDHFGAIVGLLLISEQRRIDECNGNQWAYGPVCHVVSGGVRFASPIRQSGDRGLWPLSAKLRRLIAAQMGNATLARHDLSVLSASPPDAPGPARPAPRARGRAAGDAAGRTTRGGPVSGVSFYGAGAAGFWTSFASGPAGASGAAGDEEASPALDGAPRGKGRGRGRGGPAASGGRHASAYAPRAASTPEAAEPWPQLERRWDGP